MIEIRQLSAAEGRQYLGALADVLLDCVEGGASVSFMAPLSREAAESFFDKVLTEVEASKRILLAAFLDAQLVGTVQVLTGPCLPTNLIERMSLNCLSYDQPVPKASALN